MSDENATASETNGTSIGASNGMTSSDQKPAEAAVDVQHREDETAPHKRKARGRRDKAVAAAPAVAPPVEEPVTAPVPAPQESVMAPVPAPQSVEAAGAPREPAEAPTVAQEHAAAQEPAYPYTAPHEDLRLRMKVWTDHWTGKRYLMPAAFMRDVVKGKPISDVMLAYAMRDDDTKLVTLRADEWNKLPFFYFNEDGPAPRASARPVDLPGSYERR